MGSTFHITKTEPDKMLVFGWGNVAITKDGEQVQDLQGDVIDPEELEKAAYDHVLNFRNTGERHDPGLRRKGRLVESCVFTKEKQEAMGIPPGSVPEGWWVGYKIDDPEAWDKIKKGDYKMFSIDGKGQRTPIEKADRLAKSYEDLRKFNPYHDSKGRFTGPNAAASFTYAPGRSKAHDMAIAREKARSAAAEEEKKPQRRELKLNADAIRRADDSSMMGSAGQVLAREAKRHIDDFDEKFKDDPNWSDEQRKYVAERRDKYVELVESAYNDQINRRANNPSWAVTGRAGRDPARDQKRMEQDMNAAMRSSEKMKAFEENTKSGLTRLMPEDQQIARWRKGKWAHGETISADDPLATKKLQAKLDYQVEQQNRMKAANAHYRKNGTMRGFEGISDEAAARADAAINSSWQKKPFASFQLTNNNAQIKATQQRLTELSKPKASSGSGSGGGGFAFNGGKVVRNGEANRLQIVFDGKPSAEVRQQLKSNGFRWAPSQGAWQRQLTDNAERAVQRLFGSEMQKSMDGEPITFRKADGSEVTFQREEPDFFEPGGAAPENTARGYAELRKFNPYHDARGRFSGANGATSFTYAPGKSRAHDLAIQRAKERSKEQESKRTQYTSSVTGTTHKMPELETEQAEQDRATALRHVDKYFSTKNPVKEKYDEKMSRYLEETDAGEWNKRAGKSVFSIGNDFISAKTPAERKQQAERRRDRELHDKAIERAATKGTKAYNAWRDFDTEMARKYSTQYDKRSYHSRMTEAEGKRWDELRGAMAFKNKRGQWQIAKSYSAALEELRKYNPYHDSRGRFASKNGFASYSADRRSLRPMAGEGDSLSEHIDPKTGTISKERVKEYNRIINKFLDGVEPPADGKPTLDYMGGGGGSGKSYTIKAGVVDVPGKGKAVQINADDIKLEFKEFRQRAASDDAATSMGAAGYIHEESSLVTKMLTKAAMAKGVNIVIDGVASNPKKIGKQIEEARKSGYNTVRAHYVATPTEIAAASNRDRYFNNKNKEERRYVPDKVILDAHRDVSRNFPKLADLFDSVEVVQNDRKTPVRQIAHKEKGGKLVVTDQAAYDAFISKGKS